MSATQAENGTWEVSVWYRDWQGERHRKHKRGFATKREAKAWESAFIARQDGSPDMRMHDFYELYREDRMPHLKLNTWRTKEQIIETKILPFFDEMKLCDIMPADILKWQSQLLLHRDKYGKPYSDTYLRTVSNQLSSMFNHACRYYNLPMNPVSKSRKMGNARGGEIQFWTKDEYERFSREVMDKPSPILRSRSSIGPAFEKVSCWRSRLRTSTSERTNCPSPSRTSALTAKTSSPARKRQS